MHGRFNFFLTTNFLLAFLMGFHSPASGVLLTRAQIAADGLGFGFTLDDGTGWSLNLLDGNGVAYFGYSGSGSSFGAGSGSISVLQTTTVLLYDAEGNLADSIAWKVGGIGNVYSSAVLVTPTGGQIYDRLEGSNTPHDSGAWTTNGGPAAAAPEPPAFLLGAIGTAIAAIGRRRHRQKKEK